VGSPQKGPAAHAAASPGLLRRWYPILLTSVARRPHTAAAAPAQPPTLQRPRPHSRPHCAVRRSSQMLVCSLVDTPRRRQRGASGAHGSYKHRPAVWRSPQQVSIGYKGCASIFPSSGNCPRQRVNSPDSLPPAQRKMTKRRRRSSARTLESTFCRYRFHVSTTSACALSSSAAHQVTRLSSREGVFRRRHEAVGPAADGFEILVAVIDLRRARIEVTGPHRSEMWERLSRAGTQHAETTTQRERDAPQTRSCPARMKRICGEQQAQPCRRRGLWWSTSSVHFFLRQARTQTDG